MRSRALESDASHIQGSHIIKASVDTQDGHENFITLMAYLVSLADLDVGDKAFRMLEAKDADIVEVLRGRSRSEVVPLMQAALESPLTEAEIATLSGRKEQLAEFCRLLHEEKYIEKTAEELARTVEAVWQEFFERAPWIFGYGLDFVSHAAMDEGKLERITVGNNIWAGGGKRSDAIMRTRARISTLLFCEIKRHDTKLLERTPYREPDIYAPSKELVGGTAQLQKTVRKAFRIMAGQIKQHTHQDGTPTGLEFSTTKPRQVLVIGSLAEFRTSNRINGEQMESFELYRKSHSDVEVITFDELYERARYIVGDDG